MTRNLSMKNSKDSLSISLTRIAIDSSGHLGSFYDGNQDCVLGKINIDNEEKSTESLKTTQCTVNSNINNKSSNLLQLIKMTHELRLNVLLDFAPGTGIAAIIDHPHPINKDTRVLHYTFVHREERISDTAMEARKASKSPPLSTTTTHIITGISYGVDIVVVLNLPSENNTVKRIDDVLQKIAKLITDNHNALTLDTDEENLLETITDTMAYSNISYLTRSTTVRDICVYIAENKNQFIDTPTMYTLQPIKCMFPQSKGSTANFVLLSSTDNNKIEDYLMTLSGEVKSLKQSLDVDVHSLLCGNLEKQIRDAQRHWLQLSKEHENVIKKLKQFIVGIRKGRNHISELNKVLNNTYYTRLNDLINKITQEVKDLEKKGRMITNLQKQHFRYCNAGECNVNKTDNKETLARKLSTNKQNDRILCFDDTLNKKKQHQSTLHKLQDQLVKEHETNRDLRLTYADFSYCAYELTDVLILVPSKPKKDKNIKIPRASIFSPKKKTSTQSSAEKKTSRPQPKEKKIPTPPPTDAENSTPPSLAQSTSTTEEFINILLLGESGVGKSTFINAFVNYLTYETFEKAQSKVPVVLIPVSFLMTTGQNFEEHTVKFGDFDSSKNEDFDHPGESVTQHCKSYEFDLNSEDGRKLRIIDTPGFGDTRGLDQDDRNMQHILEYINNLTHLNAVCFLLKPNASQLNTFFRVCLTELLDLLGPDACQNIIFCFTNARSTFYTPGDTAPLLRKMLKSYSINDIPFKKDNTFCFDNESFRYLLDLRNSIKFNTDEKDEYAMSWSTSVNESSRLVDYICNDLTSCHLSDKRQSIKRAHIEITLMIRPMLEAIRNILRNLILSQMNLPNKSTELCPKAIHRPGTICRSCTPYPIQVGNFSIVREITHEFVKKCLDCPCPIEEHIPIKYVLNYEYLNSPANYRQNEMVDMVHEICLAGTEFDYFLVRAARLSRDDPFLMGLVRMIKEETELYQQQKPSNLNSQLVKDLTELKCAYEERIGELESKRQQTALSVIYKWITTIREYPMIQEQLEVIKQSQHMTTELYEASED